MVVNWIRSRASKKREEPTGQHCVGCRSPIAGTTEEELRSAGGVFLVGAGWFCGARCEKQYRLRFRIQPSKAPVAAPVKAAPTPGASPAEATPATPERLPAAEELAAALRAGRRKFGGS